MSPTKVDALTALAGLQPRAKSAPGVAYATASTGAATTTAGLRAGIAGTWGGVSAKRKRISRGQNVASLASRAP